MTKWLATQKWNTAVLLGIILFVSGKDADAGNLLFHAVKHSPAWLTYALSAALAVGGVLFWRADNRLANLSGILLFVLAGFLAYGLDFYIRMIPEENMMLPEIAHLMQENPAENQPSHPSR